MWAVEHGFQKPITGKKKETWTCGSEGVSCNENGIIYLKNII